MPDGKKKKFKREVESLAQLSAGLQEKFTLPDDCIINYWDEEVDDFVELDAETWDEFVEIEKPKLKIQHHPNNVRSSSVGTLGGSSSRNPIGAVSSKKEAFKMLQILGKGAFGTTVLVLEKATGQHRAVKKIDCGNIDDANNAMAEAHAMLKVRGPYFVECFECFLEPLELGAFVCYIVMEYCDGGDLESQLRIAMDANEPFSELQLQQWLYPILTALDRLHVEHGFVHRDVKLSNILLSGSPANAKLCDFGMAKHFENASQNQSFVGTMSYMAPEIVDGGYDGCKVDIWSLGIVLWSLSALKVPQRMLVSEQQVLDCLQQMPQTYSDDLNEALRVMLTIDAERRGSASDVLSLPFFAQSKPTNTQESIQTATASSAKTAADQHLITPSVRCILGAAKSAKWMLASNIEGIASKWQQLAGTNVKYWQHDYTNVADPVASAALEEVWDAIENVPGNSGLRSKYDILKLMLVHSRARELQVHSELQDLNQKYVQKSEPGTPFFLNWQSKGTSREQAWRRAVMKKLDMYHSLDSSSDTSNVKVLLAFHAAPSEEIASQILTGNFAILATLDPGFFAQGLYFTLDAAYAISEYGKSGGGAIPLILCAVVIGNTYPVIEQPYERSGGKWIESPKGLLGKPIIPKADSHFVVVAKDRDIHHQRSEPLPVEPRHWPEKERGGQLHTELVVRHQSQVLPLGFALMKLAESFQATHSFGAIPPTPPPMQGGGASDWSQHYPDCMKWSCPVCTFENPKSHPTCEMCMSPNSENATSNVNAITFGAMESGQDMVVSSDGCTVYNSSTNTRGQLLSPILTSGVHDLIFRIDKKGDYMGFGVVEPSYSKENLEGKFLDKIGAWSVGSWKGQKDRNEVTENGTKQITGDLLVGTQSGDTLHMRIDMEDRMLSFHKNGHQSVVIRHLPSAVRPAIVLYTQDSGVTLEQAASKDKKNVSGVAKMFTYKSDFDENGLLYWIGTDGGTKQWTNPTQITEGVIVKCSKLGGGKEEYLVGRTNVHNYSADEDNSWWSVDLGVGRAIELSFYSLKHGWSNATGMGIIRNWRLEGSNDEKSWNTLRDHVNDKTMPSTPYSTATWSISSDGQAYRYFRIMGTGLNSYSSPNRRLNLCGIEFYGQMATASILSTGAALTGVGGCTQFKMDVGCHGTGMVVSSDGCTVYNSSTNTRGQLLSPILTSGVHDLIFRIDKKGDYMGFGVVEPSYSKENLEGKFLDKIGAWSVGSWKGQKDRNEVTENGTKQITGDLLVGTQSGDTLHMRIDMEDRMLSFHKNGHQSVVIRHLPSAVRPAIVLYTQDSGVTLEQAASKDKKNVSGVAKMFTYKSDFDENGLLYWIGTDGGTKQWTNPTQITEGVIVKCSKLGGGKEEYLVGRTNVHNYSADEDNSWWSVDLGVGRAIELSFYSLKHGWSNATGMGIIRNWRLEGSNDEKSWNTLRDHVNDKTMPSTPYSTATWSISSDGQAYRYFRIMGTGLNSYSSPNRRLNLCGIEFYGQMATASILSTGAALTGVGGCTQFKMDVGCHGTGMVVSSDGCTVYNSSTNTRGQLLSPILTSGVHDLIFRIDKKGDYMGFGVVEPSYSKENLEGKFLDKIGAWSVGSWKGQKDRNEVTENGTKQITGDLLVGTQSGDTLHMRIDMEDRMLSFHKNSHQSVVIRHLPSAVRPAIVLYTQDSGVTLEQAASKDKKNVSGVAKMFTYKSDFDENGLLYWIGTDGGTKQWTNPAQITEGVIVKCSKLGGGKEEYLVGRTNVHNYSADEDNSWWSVDLGVGRAIELSFYSLKHGWSNATGMGIIRNWRLEGSNDEKSWNTLRDHVNDKTMPSTPYSTATWSISSDGQAYRYFRIMGTGLNSYSSPNRRLNLCGIEFYGQMATASILSTGAALTGVGGCTQFKMDVGCHGTGMVVSSDGCTVYNSSTNTRGQLLSPILTSGVHDLIFRIDKKGDYMGFGVVEPSYSKENLEGKFLDKIGAWSVGSWKGQKDRNEVTENGTKQITGDLLVGTQSGDTLHMRIDMEDRMLSFHKNGHQSVVIRHLPSAVRPAIVLYTQDSGVTLLFA